MNPAPAKHTAQPEGEEIVAKKAVWLKIGLMLVVLVPFISCIFYFIYFWLHGVSFAR